jgi:two-component system, OmpR family, osmolarity sensor histidine kinase EnvZ
MKSLSMRRPWPRSLFGRHLLLMAALLLAGVATTTIVFRWLVQGPNVRQYAAFTAQQVNAMSQALELLPPQQRGQRLAALRDSPLARYELAAPPAGEFGDPGPFLIREFLATIRQRLGPGAQVHWRPSDAELWVALPRLEPRLWLVMSASGLVRDVGYAALMMMAGSAALALIGAVAISRRIDQPLRELGEAARALAATGNALPISERVPTELAEAARRFNAMAASLARADEERVLMLAGISHDLRTPLAKLRLGVEMLARDDEAELIERLRRACTDIDAIVAQFLDYARFGGRAAAHTTPVDLAALARGVAAGFDELEPPLRLELAELGPIAADAPALQRALTNLVANAVKHGGADVTVSLAREGDCAVFAVRDRGPGILPAQVDHLKRPFTQGDASRRRGGTGLGLAIAEGAARAHRGSLELRPRAGGGLDARLLIAARPA